MYAAFKKNEVVHLANGAVELYPKYLKWTKDGTRTNILLMCMCVYIYRLSQEGHEKLLVVTRDKNEGNTYYLPYYLLYVLSYFSNFVPCRHITYLKLILKNKN